MDDEIKFNDKFAIDIKNDDRLYLVCLKCYWLFLLPVYPSLDTILSQAKWHYRDCKTQEETP